MSEAQADFRSRLRELGISQTDFANATGTPLRTVAGWCGNNSAPPTAWCLLELVAALPAARAWLLADRASVDAGQNWLPMMADLAGMVMGRVLDENPRLREALHRHTAEKPIP